MTAPAGFGVRRFFLALMCTATLLLNACGGDALPDNSRLEQAFADGRSGIWLSGHGTVIRTLGSDENTQRFQVRINPDLGLVIRHDLTAATAVPVERGDLVGFHGRYEFHGGGGQLTLTHADPDQPGGGGWILHQGIRYD